MKDPMKVKHRLVHSTDELKGMILEHPDLPMLVFAGDEANTGDYSYTVCTSVGVKVGEYLDCLNEVSDEIIFTDREYFEEELADKLFDKHADLPDDEWEALIQKKMEEYAPYWKPCIIVFVDN